MFEYHSVSTIKENRFRRRVGAVAVGVGAQQLETILLCVRNHEQSNRVAANQVVDGVSRIESGDIKKIGRIIFGRGIEHIAGGKKHELQWYASRKIEPVSHRIQQPQGRCRIGGIKSPRAEHILVPCQPRRSLELKRFAVDCRKMNARRPLLRIESVGVGGRGKLRHFGAKAMLLDIIITSGHANQMIGEIVAGFRTEE